MIVWTELVTKAEGTDEAEFGKRWLHDVSQVSARLPRLRKYIHNRIIDRRQIASVAPRGNINFDAIDQYWFDSPADLRAALASSVAREAVVAADAMSARRQRLTILQNPVIPPDPDSSLLKRMSTLRCREGVSFTKFQQEWFDLHAVLLKRLPYVGGYIQNLVLDRVDMQDKTIAQDDLPVDGIVELWFESVEAIEAAFANPVARTLQAHGLEFISEISTFLVEPRQLV